MILGIIPEPISQWLHPSFDTLSGRGARQAGMLKWGITLSHRSTRSSAFSSAPVPSSGDSASMPPRGSSGIVSCAIFKAVARSHGRAPWGMLRRFAVPGLSRNTSKAHWPSLPRDWSARGCPQEDRVCMFSSLAEVTVPSLIPTGDV